MNIEYLCKYVYEDLNGLITSVRGGSEQIITFECDELGKSNVRRVFEIRCEDVVESNVSCSQTGSIDFCTEHPLLWDYSGQRGYLYYSSPPDNRHELFALIWEAHERTFKGWRPVTDYANVRFSKESIVFCPDSNGLLADGPKKILDVYEAVAKGYVKTNFVPSVKLGGDFKALIFDECFLICESVSVAEILS